MISPLVIVAVEHAVGQITLNRPDKRNALTAAMLQQILDGLDRFERGGDVRVVLIRGVGAAFCSGLDLDDMKSAHERTGSFDFELLLEVFARLAHHPNPTIAMVHGVAIAGGCELALHCDLRIGSPSARFAMPLAKLGLVIPGAAAERLVQIVGLPAAREMLFTGEAIDGLRAERMGLLTRLVDAGQLQAATEQMVGAMAQRAPLSLQAMKRILDNFGPKLTTAERAATDMERRQINGSQDMREGLQAFFERRTPIFRGV